MSFKFQKHFALLVSISQTYLMLESTFSPEKHLFPKKWNFAPLRTLLLQEHSTGKHCFTLWPEFSLNYCSVFEDSVKISRDRNSIPLLVIFSSEMISLKKSISISATFMVNLTRMGVGKISRSLIFWKSQCTSVITSSRTLRYLTFLHFSVISQIQYFKFCLF